MWGEGVCVGSECWKALWGVWGKCGEGVCGEASCEETVVVRYS